MNWINQKIIINCLANSPENALEIANLTKQSILIGVLSKKYSSTKEAIAKMKHYNAISNDMLSIGLGSGDPKMWKRVAKIGEQINPAHLNQVFSATGFTRALVKREDTIINSLISPSGKVGFVKISTGEFSQNCLPAIVPVETAVVMAKEQGANAIKFFNMQGLKYLEEFKEVAKMCAKHQMILEPTGGITLTNFEQIVDIALRAGVQKIIPHVYSSIIDPQTGNTKIIDLKKLLVLAKNISAPKSFY